MRWLRNRVTCLWLISSLAFSCGIKAQDVEATYNFASHLYEKGDYESALKYYERANFFGNGYKRTDCYVHLGNCYNELQNIDEANTYYELAYFSTESDSLKNELIFLRAENMILQKKFLFALQEVFNLNATDSVMEKRQDFYLGVIYFGLQKFDESKEYFRKTLSATDSISFSKLDELFKKNEKVSRINPKTARILSMIIPGLGQFYSGDVRNGINSLLITSALMLLVVDVTITYSFVDAVGSVFPWYFRYYMGGYKRAETIALRRIDIKRAKIYRRIIDTIQSSSNNQ